ncbi:unnamed protein product [Phytophthora fragariaefolia]|uniref:Unnamed protein product n=1 Tax=Phytophthora fragariaefolia TaxID=1490495 RepID=A0A9W6U8N6_9STRA|nr:unnamed protein product [Phytophthora fragariaefolia]
MASVATSLGGAWSLPVRSSLSFSPTSTSRSLVLHRAELARRCSSSRVDAAPAVSPTAVPPLASSVAETAAPNSSPSLSRPDDLASTLLASLSASSAGAESVSARSPTSATAKSSAGSDDSAVGSTQLPPSSDRSTP